MNFCNAEVFPPCPQNIRKQIVKLIQILDNVLNALNARTCKFGDWESIDHHFN